VPAAELTDDMYMGATPRARSANTRVCKEAEVN
jgi:hypothetical protein